MPLGKKKKNSEKITPHFVLRTMHYLKWEVVTFLMSPNGNECLIKNKEQNATSKHCANYCAQ